MMRSLLGHQPLVVTIDGDEVVLTGMVAGPAGSHGFEVAGMTIEIDAASSGVLNRVTIENASQLSIERHSLLALLLGSDHADELVEMLARGDHKGRLDGQSNITRHSSRGSVDTDVAALATVLSTAARPGLLIEEAAVLALAAAVLGQRVDLLTAMPELVREAEAAAQLLVDHGPELAATLGTRGVFHAIATLNDVIPLLPTALGAAVHALAMNLSPAEDRPTIGSPPLGEGIDATFSVDSLPLLVADQQPTVRHLSNDEYEVRLPGWADRIDDWWVRVYLPGDAAAVAIVPLMPAESDAVATFLLDPTEHGSIELDIVDDAFEPRSSPHLAAFKAALAAGRRATRLERLGEIGPARAQWLRSADLHNDAGDEWRSRTARAIADNALGGSQPLRRLRIQPIITDVTGPIV